MGCVPSVAQDSEWYCESFEKTAWHPGVGFEAWCLACLPKAAACAASPILATFPFPFTQTSLPFLGALCLGGSHLFLLVSSGFFDHTWEEVLLYTSGAPRNRLHQKLSRQRGLLVSWLWPCAPHSGFLAVPSHCFLILLSRFGLDRHTFFLWSEA